MYYKIAAVLTPVLALAVIGIGYWGYQENQEKNTILIKAENQYQRAFHDLTNQIGNLRDELGRTLAISSRDMMATSLTNVWRLTYSAQNDIGQLPLSLIPFNKTQGFLSEIADFAYKVGLRDLDKEPLTNQEWKTLQTLYQRSSDIEKELRGVQAKVISNQLRWMDVELAMAHEDQKADNVIIDGFKTIDKQVQEYPEIEWGAGVNNLGERRKEKIKNIAGDPITPEQAKQIAAHYTGEKADRIEVSKNGDGLEYASYSVVINPQNHKHNIYIDLTQKGGHLIWLMSQREIGQQRLNVDQAREKADAFLKAHDYPSMTLVNQAKYDNVVVFNYAYQQNGVIIYPDELILKVALDNGEVIGVDAQKYLLSHKKRQIDKAKLTEEEALKGINGRLAVFNVRPAMIENKNGEEVLTFEVQGKLNGSDYQIYVNAMNGKEEKVEQLPAASL